MTRLLALALLLALGAPSGHAQHDAHNMTLVGHLDEWSRYGDVWGYADPATGREYALLTARDHGLSIIDVTADQPVEVGFVPGLTDTNGNRDSKDVKTYGPYAYLVNEYAPIQIISIADPAAPVQVGTLDVQPDVSLGGSHNILIEGDHLYVIGGRSPGGLRIYALSDPTAPAFVGEFQPAYYHDVYLHGDLLYAAKIYNQGIDVLDVSDKANPTLVSSFTYAVSTYMGAHNVCGTEDGAYIFVGDEIGSEPHTRAFDVTDLDDVEQVADLVVNAEQPVHNCYVRDGLLYIAHYTEGARVFDVSDPTSPVEVAYFDTYPAPEVGVYRGAWTVYPYLASGKLLVSDMQTGLYVLRLDGAVAAEPGAVPATGFALGASYPNPFVTATTIPFTLAERAHVRLVVLDVLGREAAVLTDGVWGAGTHEVRFDGSQLPAGAYFYRLEAGGLGASATRPLTLLR
jgi:choice-of-anchor B domain-containing protein